jgi:uncharacterized protein (DUF1330 family)
VKGYILAQVDVHDPQAYEAYRTRTAAVIEQYGGRFIARGGKVEALEGEVRRNRLVILEFPSTEAARTFYESPEYQAILPFRTRASEADLLLIEGYDG